MVLPLLTFMVLAQTLPQGSLGGAFGLEYLNRTLRFERDVERYLKLFTFESLEDIAETMKF